MTEMKVYALIDLKEEIAYGLKVRQTIIVCLYLSVGTFHVTSLPQLYICASHNSEIELATLHLKFDI